jgi:hypothetical protein
MLQHCWKSVARLAIFGGLLALIAGGHGSAVAQDGNVITEWERKIWGGFSRSLGLRGPDDPQIEYRERSPLVVPPTRDLPPPQAAGASKTANWPVDPDAKRAKERADKKKKQVGGAGFQDSDTLGNPLTPDELNPPGRPAPKASGKNTMDPRDGRALLPSDLGYFGGLFSWRGFGFGASSEEVGTFTSEPPRDSLTEPPVGYQTPSPAQPYGVSKGRDPSKATPADPAVGQP